MKNLVSLAGVLNRLSSARYFRPAVLYLVDKKGRLFFLYSTGRLKILRYSPEPPYLEGARMLSMNREMNPCFKKRRAALAIYPLVGAAWLLVLGPLLVAAKTPEVPAALQGPGRGKLREAALEL
jgi:hypothetical protein